MCILSYKWDTVGGDGRFYRKNSKFHTKILHQRKFTKIQTIHRTAKNNKDIIFYTQTSSGIYDWAFKVRQDTVFPPETMVLEESFVSCYDTYNISQVS